MARWRHSFYKLVPSWLSNEDGGKVLYSLGTIADAFVERVRRSLTARFPTYSGPTGLRMMGEERGIVRGRDENNDGFARRLREWRGPRGHLVRGNPFAALRQIWNYFGGISVEMLDSSGNVYSISRAGEESATHGGPQWNWDAPDATVYTPAHDAAAGTDTGDALILPQTSSTLTLHCDGTPGRLIFLNINSGRVNARVVQRGNGWVEVANNITTSGTGHPYNHHVFMKIVRSFESFTSVVVDCYNDETVGGGARFIGRAVNVPGEYRSDCVVSVQMADSDGTSATVPGVSGALSSQPCLQLAFVGGRLTTYAAAAGGWTEIDAERTAGATGIAVDEQYLQTPTSESTATSIALGATSAVSVIVVTVVSKLQLGWYRFWLRIVPDADQMLAWGTWAEDEARGPTGTWADGANETWGQTGVTPGDAAMVRDLFRGARPWKMAGTKAEWLLVELEPDVSAVPDGTWGSWIQPGGAPSTRPRIWRFWKL